MNIEIGYCIVFPYDNKDILTQATENNLELLRKIRNFRYASQLEAALIKGSECEAIDLTAFRKTYNFGI